MRTIRIAVLLILSAVAHWSITTLYDNSNPGVCDWDDFESAEVMSW